MRRAPSRRIRSAPQQLTLTNSATPPRLRKARGHARIPTRLLMRPLPIETPLKIGGTLVLNHEIYTIERLRFDHRLKNVEWWGDRPVSRDYLWLSLAGAVGKLEAFGYVDRESGRVFVQGMRD